MRSLLIAIVILIGLVVAGVAAIIEEYAGLMLAVVCAWNPVVAWLGYSLAGAGIRISIGNASVTPRSHKPNAKQITDLLADEL